MVRKGIVFDFCTQMTQIAQIYADFNPHHPRAKPFLHRRPLLYHLLNPVFVPQRADQQDVVGVGDDEVGEAIDDDALVGVCLLD